MSGYDKYKELYLKYKIKYKNLKDSIGGLKIIATEEEISELLNMYYNLMIDKMKAELPELIKQVKTELLELIKPEVDVKLDLGALINQVNKNEFTTKIINDKDEIIKELKKKGIDDVPDRFNLVFKSFLRLLIRLLDELNKSEIDSIQIMHLIHLIEDGSYLFEAKKKFDELKKQLEKEQYKNNLLRDNILLTKIQGRFLFCLEHIYNPRLIKLDHGIISFNIQNKKYTKAEADAKIKCFYENKYDLYAFPYYSKQNDVIKKCKMY